jgi:thiamine kinase-like enzyme
MVFAKYGENAKLLKEDKWKFSREKLEQINKGLDRFPVAKVISGRLFDDLISSLEKLKEKYPDMKDLIEEIMKKLKNKKLSGKMLFDK